MKKILISLSIIGVVAVIAIGATIAYFNDTETSTGNILVAGTMDLKVDHLYAMYNENDCYCREVGNQLITNGGFETPALAYGTWVIYSDGTQTSWEVESGAGLEIQNHAAGTPKEGNQLAELDSYNSSVIYQMIPTVAGKQYRFTFWYSPRPNVPAGDNAIGVNVKVTSGTMVVIDDIVGASSAGGSQTNWQQFTYYFIATDASTKITFSDEGTYSNSYGGYLDDISVKEFVCDYPAGGTCNLWSLKDLEEGDFFWSFDDVKPGDYGKNIISLHAYSNDAFACLINHNIKDYENVCIGPEIAVSDPTCGTEDDQGELSGFLKAFVWVDSIQNNKFDAGETVLYGPNAAFTGTNTMAPISLTASDTEYIGIAWCFGTQSVDPGTGVISCSGSGNQDIAQTDSFLSDFTAYAEQQRNNPGFDCMNVQLQP